MVRAVPSARALDKALPNIFSMVGMRVVGSRETEAPCSIEVVLVLRAKGTHSGLCTRHSLGITARTNVVLSTQRQVTIGKICRASTPERTPGVY